MTFAYQIVDVRCRFFIFPLNPPCLAPARTALLDVYYIALLPLGVIITFGKRGHISQGASIKADISSVTDDVAAPHTTQ